VVQFKKNHNLTALVVSSIQPFEGIKIDALTKGFYF